MPIRGCDARSAAWWSCVVEAEDLHARALREALGEEEAIAWARASAPGPLPLELRGEGRRWEEAWERWRPRVLAARHDAELEALAALDGRLLIPGDPDWPSGLADLGPAEPIALWTLGRLPGRECAAIVGARAATALGERTARSISCELAEGGVAIVSGGAFGIDIAAHRGALDAQGETLAIMAGGVASPYPAAHERDFAEILARGGGLASESPPSWRPAKWRFLGRNRIIAALAGATVVVEASARSGALATARRALALGRPVGAVPGAVSSAASIGCHDLIRTGATLVRDAGEVRELLAPFAPGAQGALFGDPVAADAGVDALAPVQRRVWEALPKRSSTTLTRLARAAGLSEREVLSALAELELSGLVDSSTRGWRRRAT